jgi:hypothetical protein
MDAIRTEGYQMAGQPTVRYNRVLFNGPLGWALIQAEGGVEIHTVDGSSLSFIVEELVARCAVSVVIPDSVGSGFVGSLDPLLARRVETVSSLPVLRKVHALLEPVAEELPVRFLGTAVEFGAALNDKQLRGALSSLYFRLTDYLLAQHYRTQVDINLDALRNAVGTVRSYSRSPRSRAVMAALAGLLNAYTPMESGALVTTTAASGDMVRLFNELVEDAGYLQASETAHWLGLPTKAARAAFLLRRSVKAIVSRKPFSQLFTLGTRAVTAATSLPLPDSEAVAEILGTEFLPPLVSLRDAVEAALESWEGSDTPPVYPASLPPFPSSAKATRRRVP